MSHPAVAILQNYKDIVWPQVEKALLDPAFFPQFAIPDRFQEEYQFHKDLVAEYPRRQGKYVRPTLVMLAGLSMGSSKEQLPVTAAAMQLSEEWLLVHDDLEDGSLGRRGKQTLHTKYSIPLAVNAGDALHNVMWRTLASNKSILGDSMTFTLFEEFNMMLARTILGQTTEIHWARENHFDFTDEDWFFICDGKTSYYTIALPMRLGAIIAGASEEQLNTINDFGIPLGRCFQIVDDLLDLTGDFAGRKGQVANDLYEGKRTLILGHVYRSLPEPEKKRLKDIMSLPREKKSPEDIEWVLSVMKEYGSLDYARALAEKYKAEALHVFNEKLPFFSSEPYRTELSQIIDFILNRDH